ncbi:hypothetical protein Trydic_g6996 [Trypoxylus dichotomus]
MGSPLSPVVANIFMESFECVALEISELKPKAWFRYVDDSIIWPHGRDTLDSFFGYLNSQHPDIKFTMEVEKNSVEITPFLDVLVTQKPNGRLVNSIHRKPTHTNRYLPADSHHQKLSVVNSVVRRAVSISEANNLSKKLQHVKSTLQNSGYRCRDIQVIKNHIHPSNADKS